MSPDPNSHRRRNRLRTAQRSEYAPRCHFSIVVGYTRIVEVLPGARNALHTADPCITQRRRRSRTLQTQESHTADPSIAHCRPERHTLQTRASHTADPSVAHCRPERRTLQTRASHTANPSAGQTTYTVCVRNLAVHKRIGVRVCL